MTTRLTSPNGPTARQVASDEIKPRSRRYRVTPHTAATALVLLLAAGGVWAGASWLGQRLTHVTENDAQVAAEVVTISSRTDGWLLTRPVIEGDPVRKGQVLGEVDTRDAKLRLKTLEGSVAARASQIH